MNFQFALDKSAAAIYEAIAIGKIEAWYAAQGLRIHARYNEANGLTEKRGYDLIDTFGKTWEVKTDRLWGTTGNVFLEHQAIEHSQADMFIILAGWAFILTRAQVVELMNGPYRQVDGGDNNWAHGTLIPVAALAAQAEIA